MNNHISIRPSKSSPTIKADLLVICKKEKRSLNYMIEQFLLAGIFQYNIKHTAKKMPDMLRKRPLTFQEATEKMLSITGKNEYSKKKTK